MPQNQPTILIIDNCPEDRATYGSYLLQDRRYSYRILEEEYGEKGLELCKAVKPDAILLDFPLPDIKGLEFLKQLKTQLGTTNLPVVMLASQDNEAIAVAAMKSGVAGYLVKTNTTAECVRCAIHNIIERANLKLHLEDTEERFRTSIENMLDCFGIYTSIRDQSGKIIDFRVDYVNGAACQSNRMTKDEQIGKNLCKLLPTHREIGLFDEYCQVVETGKPLLKESMVYSEIYDQQYLTRVFDIRATKLGDGFVASWRDVTEQKQIQEQLIEKQQFIQRIADTTPGILYLYDLIEQRNLYINYQSSEFLGYSSPEVLAMGAEFTQKVMHPEDFARLPAHIARFNLTPHNAVFSFEYRMRHANGEWHWFHSRDTVFARTADGLPRQILGTAQDITDRKQAEEELRRANERFQLAAAAVNCLIYDWDIEKNTVERTEGLTQILGYSLAESEPTRDWWLALIHPDDLQTLQEQTASTLATGDRCVTEYRVRHKDNQYRYVQDHALLIRDAQGRLVRVVGSTIDITERQQLYQLEQEARAEAEAANRAKDDFVAMVSHDLRAPLNSILGWAQILRTRKPDEATVARALETIERNAHDQAQLLEDLLDLSRMIRGKLELKLCQVTLVPIIEGAINTVYLAAQAKAIRLESQLDQTIAPFPCDPKRLQQVLENLLSNAIKFTPEGGRIDVRLERGETHIQITVSDTGQGISAEFLPYIFERFRQAHHTTRQNGLGLGLAIVRHLVELHSGKIQAYSPGEGQGATFTITLPLLGKGSGY
ncbi:MAG TPA: hybrid sensor histidine kinase/response regulator [Cyanobacteria bacterium UBA8803]|nr:hybrid sensor histidine kinase/response regulator [Cyanobacteria bacterium UBA9273]HBL60212.1 hybrid sensor histidine kinase/response regulator [Cyanobacteria bacterium UBA8803]